MEIFFAIIFSLVIICSLVTTFIAIYQILTNEFKDSKVLWIFISMMAIVGPILYLTKGRKLLVKKTTPIDENKHKKHVLIYYKDLLFGLNPVLKGLFLISVLSFFSGYLFRFLNIYFFWESKQIGFFLLIIFVLFVFRIDITKRNLIEKKTIAQHIFFWLISFFVFVKVLVVIILLNSNAYKAAKTNLKSNPDLQQEVGSIQDLIALPQGSLSIKSYNGQESGSATIHFLIKGTRAYSEKTVFVSKNFLSDWEVVEIY